MTRFFLPALLAAFLALPASALDKGELAEAADLYRSASYDAALESYLDLIKQDPENPYLHYNAGNCLWRKGRTGEAIARYARAFLSAPRDGDVRRNLEFSLAQTGQNLVPQGVPAVLHRLYYLLSDAELKALTLLLFWGLCLAVSLSALRPALRPALGDWTYVLGAALAFCSLWTAARGAGTFRSAGVVTVDNSRLLSGPGPAFKTSASIKAGTLVKVLDAADEEYAEIGIPSEGVKGWIDRRNLERI